MGRFTGILGLIAILAVAWLLSRHKRAIQWRVLAWGLAATMLFVAATRLVAVPRPKTAIYAYQPPLVRYLDQIGAEFLEWRQVEACHVPVDVDDLASGIVLRGEQAHLDEGVGGEDTHGFDAGISGRPQNRNFDPVGRSHWRPRSTLRGINT